MSWTRLLETCRDAGMAPVWRVRLRLEPTPALFMREHGLSIPEGLVHQARDRRWLLTVNEKGNLVVHPCSDQMTRWDGTP